MPDTLESVIGLLPPKIERNDTFSIDLAAYFPGVESVLVFHKMRASLLFGDSLAGTVQMLKNQQCTEDESTQLEMAFIIACHQEPPVASPASLVPCYIEIFQRLTEIQKWQFVKEFQEKGGGEFIEKMAAMIAAKKNGTKAPAPGATERNGKSSASPSVTSNATRPKLPSRLRTSRKLQPTNSWRGETPWPETTEEDSLG